jgi:hypothetical protein
MYKLGKKPAKFDDRTPSLREVMGTTMYGVTTARGWYQAVQQWPMLANDEISNCTIAACLHAEQLWQTAAGNGVRIIPDRACAVAGYAHATGYDPITGKGDNGAYLIDILNYWMKVGLPITSAGALSRLDGYAWIDPKDHEAVLAAIDTFGCVYTGTELPNSAQIEVQEGREWMETDQAPGGWGGHCMLGVSGPSDGVGQITWARLQREGWHWWDKYTSECYALLRRDWLTSRDISPSGFNMAQLDNMITGHRGLLGLGAY